MACIMSLIGSRIFSWGGSREKASKPALGRPDRIWSRPGLGSVAGKELEPVRMDQLDVVYNVDHGVLGRKA